MRARITAVAAVAGALVAGSVAATAYWPEGGPQAATPGPGAGRQPAQRHPTSREAAELAMIGEVNQARVGSGCPLLHWDSRLATASARHSADMADRGYFAHTSPDGETPWDRAHAAGYAEPGAENIAAGSATFDATMHQWLDSSGHRANIMNCKFVAMGVGEAEGGPMHHYWTQMFGYR